MCAAKSPISALQEYSMKNSLPLPSYQIASQGSGGFYCKIVFGDITECATAENKKRAKHICAEKMLYKLSMKDDLSNSSDDVTNFVGVLNELCSGKGVSYPSYTDLGYLNQKFIIECQYMSYSTTGEGSTKKEAKRNAAKKMINRMQSPDIQLTIQHQDETKRAINLELDNKVTALFKNLTIRNKIELESSQKLAFPIESSQKLAFPIESPQKLAFPIESPQKLTSPREYETPNIELRKRAEKINHMTERELRNEFKKMGIYYKITEFDKDPERTILTLKTLPTSLMDKSYTFMYADKCYDIAMLELLRTALNGLETIRN